MGPPAMPPIPESPNEELTTPSSCVIVTSIYTMHHFFLGLVPSTNTSYLAEARRGTVRDEKMSKLEDWVTTKGAADLTDYNVNYLRHLLRTGRIEAQKVQRDWLINRESLLAYKRRMDRLGPQKHNPWRTLPRQSGELGS